MNIPTSGGLRQAMLKRDIIPFIGCYDVFSASIAGRYYDGIFVSGFGFAASYYGLPDIGFISWSDMISYVQRIKTVLPDHFILVDIDDGYADVEVACHVASLLESIGISGIIIEDQQRPRKCGHFDGKQLMPLSGFVQKLEKVLSTRKELVVVARTDSDAPDDMLKRAKAFADIGADAVLVDGLKDLGVLKRLHADISKPLMFNQIAGGKSPPCTLQELKSSGVSLVNYSTPCLFAAQEGIEKTLRDLQADDGLLKSGSGHVGVQDCTKVLQENLARRKVR